MIEVSNEMIVRCYSDFKTDAEENAHAGRAEVCFAETKDLLSYYPLFYKWVSEAERSRAKKMISEKERETYITCHALLRLMLAGKINSDPSELSFSKGVHNKPGLPGDSLFFNISHTREAFAIGISENNHVGLDIENLNRKIDIYSVSRNYFSRLESDYTMRSAADQVERFFLIWTRKEALLKAIGTGITDDLDKIEVSEPVNTVDAGLFTRNYCNSHVNNHFLYSKKIADHYLSVAMPTDQPIDFTHIDSENINSWIVQFRSYGFSEKGN
jgi:phosphopantetheinyl transferase